MPNLGQQISPVFPIEPGERNIRLEKNDLRKLERESWERPER